MFHSASSPPSPSGSPGTTPVASLDLCGCRSTRLQPKPPQLTPTTVGLAPPAVHLHTCHQRPLSAYAQGDCAAMGDPGPLQLLVGPGKALSPVTRLHHCTHPLLDSAAVHLHTPSLTSITSLHRHVPILRESSHSSAHQQPVCPQLAPTRTPSVCSYHYMYVCLQPAPATIQALSS